MSHEPDPRPVLESAREAAGAGHYESAERLLREALARQEASLGPLHPDVANTLNNIAVVCERLGRVADAEQGYRRAHAIAVASLPPGHPFIKTSLKNLVDFCVARGIPLYTPPAARPVGATSATGTDAATPASEPASAGAPPAPRRAPILGRDISRRAAAVAALVVLPLAALLLFTVPWQGTGDSSTPTTAPGSESGAVAPSPPVAHPAPVAESVPDPVAAADAESSAPPPDPLPDPSTGPPREAAAQATGGEDDAAPAATTSALQVTVVTAQVCTSFDRRGAPDWQCTPAADVNPPGTFTFYTRLRTASDTIVEHRWYRDDRPYQTLRLDVGANPGSGFRTFSRSAIGADRPGAWRVEVRAADGTLLDEARFVVR